MLKYINSNKVYYLSLQLENEDGSQYFLEPSDENNCNWMMFVRPADNFSEQNVVAFQYKMDIFYVTTKHIDPKEELKVICHISNIVFSDEHRWEKLKESNVECIP